MGADGWISMLFPAKPADVRLTPYETAEAQEALGATTQYIYVSFLFCGAVSIDELTYLLYSTYGRIAIK